MADTSTGLAEWRDPTSADRIPSRYAMPTAADALEVTQQPAKDMGDVESFQGRLEAGMMGLWQAGPPHGEAAKTVAAPCCRRTRLHRGRSRTARPYNVHSVDNTVTTDDLDGIIRRMSEPRSTAKYRVSVTETDLNGTVPTRGTTQALSP